jgi:hypothetical protein
MPETPQLSEDEHKAYIFGFPDGNVYPERFVTREEAVAMFYRILTEEARAAYRSKAIPYSDIESGRWSADSISCLTEAGIVCGYPDAAFRPSQFMTRAEFAVLALQFSKGNESSRASFPDIKGHWAEGFILRASAQGLVQGYEDGKFSPESEISRAEAVALINRALRRHVESSSDLLDGMRVWPDNLEGTWYCLDIQEASNSHGFTRKEDGLSEVWDSIKH